MIRGLAALAVVLAACGGSTSITAELRSRLGSPEGRAAREDAPDLVAAVEEALADAEVEERAGRRDAAADHLTRARLLLDAAQAEAARIADERERRRVEARVAELLERARRDESAREAIGRELSRMAAVRAAREEALRALEQAAQDEARPRRRARVSLEEVQDLRRAASVLRARARLSAAAARALGAPEETLRAVEEALAASEAPRLAPLAALEAADRARAEAQRALGEARRRMDAPEPDAARALAEAARAEGFEVVALPEGIAVEVDGLFRGRAVARGAHASIERLAALAAAHPHGTIEVQAQAGPGRGGEALAAQRAEALRRALVEAGADAQRLRASALPAELAGDAPADRARLLFLAYAAR
ncbi:MAG TPA: hypothetical protein VIL20_22945 [Sandaracinaceae bacterium]